MKMPSPMRRWEDQLPPVEKTACVKACTSCLHCLPRPTSAPDITRWPDDAGHRQDSWHFDHAAMAIGVAVVADGLDGRIARMTNTTSEFGREFDSLADVITFGVAPALLAFMWGFGRCLLADFARP